MRPVGLRGRVIAGFAAGALVLSASMALVSYQLIRGSLLAERERTAVRAAYFNATVVNSGLTGDHPDMLEVLRSLDTGSERKPVLRRAGTWYARSADGGVTASIPEPLQRMAEEGTPGKQRIRADGQPAVVVAVPLSASTVFYQIDSLQELERTFQILALVLTLVAAMTTGAGAALGWYATGYVLRPLSSVAAAAQEITAGDLTARLDPASEPDLARLTTSFNHMVDQLARRMERDRRFAADVSHELRSPLQTLAAAASVLNRRRDRLDDRTATAADLVTDEIARFQTLVDDLLELARSDQPADRRTVDVSELARGVCRTRGISEQIIQGDDQTWSVDEQRIEQLLGNLVDNAIRYGGGPTAIRLGCHDGRHFIEVDDEGPGVSPEDKEVIFDRFVRGRTAQARGDVDGTGLGLALVAGHADAHGGRATVLDRPGGGARFRVELPGCAP
ncbi:HAMP domain-containing histidine kinase [Micromonospora sp. CPCC 205371]|nr:HAMP domain-containing histidine kinase [Micromonospora sp. CPCC 205371]